MSERVTEARLSDRQKEVLARIAGARGRCSTAYAGKWPACSAPTYRALRRLEDLGLVDHEQLYYWPYWAITPAGRRALEQGGRE